MGNVTSLRHPGDVAGPGGFSLLPALFLERIAQWRGEGLEEANIRYANGETWNCRNRDDGIHPRAKRHRWPRSPLQTHGGLRSGGGTPGSVFFRPSFSLGG